MSDTFRKNNESYLTPLFWVHGEAEEKIRNTISEIQKNGINSFIIEARPHVNYLKDQWWNDIRIIIDQAKELSMDVWLFDDGDYPSGSGNNQIVKDFPQYRKQFLRLEYMDALGPMKDSSFLVKRWLEDEESIVGLVAGKIDTETRIIDETSLIDISDLMEDGILYWDIPCGQWQVYMLIKSYDCPEDHTKNHVNFLDNQAVRAFIDTTYEPTYERFKDDFGKTFKGFFTDEPRFGNYPSYIAKLGIKDMPLPFSDDLISILSQAFGQDIMKYLPLLWFEGQELMSKVRFTYMDTVSRLFEENFSKQIGDWCHERNVKLIGHVIEENGAHARIGYGAGHFFRSISGFDVSGLDIVYNLMPGYTSGQYKSAFFDVDVDFSHWGISKMASSASHIDPKKNGITVCEAFGAYGWQEGLKLMKWITDHLCVRGINVIIPHAITMKDFPDPDCPPHFYADGHNPQWKDFNIWSSYANRVCHLLTDGIHKASVGVLYHAEAEWAGDYEPFEKTVKALSLRQIDSDILPIDALMEEDISRVVDHQLVVNKESYEALVLPYAEYLPEYFEDRLKNFADLGLPIIFMKKHDKVNDLKLDHIVHCDYTNIADYLEQQGYYDISLSSTCDSLRHYHYSKDGREIYYFVNESKFDGLDTFVSFKENTKAYLYDPMKDISYIAQEADGSIHLELKAYESVFVIFEKNHDNKLDHRYNFDSLDIIKEVSNQWKISTSTIEDYPKFVEVGIDSLQNISGPKLLPEFSGIIRYEKSFDLEETYIDQSECIMMDLGSLYETANVWLNDKLIGTMICPPYQVQLPKDSLLPNGNKLQIEVTNTLAKKMNDNRFDRFMPQEPSGLLGPVVLAHKPGTSVKELS